MTTRERMLQRRRAALARKGWKPRDPQAGATKVTALDALLTVGLFVDKVANAVLPSILWGEWGTISAKLGRTKAKHGGRVPWFHPLAKVVDAGLEQIDPNHSIDAARNEDVV